MRGLIIKDFKLLKLSSIFAVIVGLIIAYVGTTSMMVYKSQLIYGYGIFILLYISIMFMTQRELKAKSDIIFNSFPVKRDEIVTARYVVFLLYLLFISAIIYLGSNMLMFSTRPTIIGEPAKIRDILLITGLCLIFMSLYFPFEYYNLGKAQVLNSIFYMLMILLPNILSRYGDKIYNSKIFKKLIKLDFNTITIVLLGLGIILYIISLQISKQIYKAKEF